MSIATAPIPGPRSGGAPGPAALLKVEHLKTYFPVRRGLLRSVVGYVRAVSDVSFHVDKQETLGLVGESGCGKSTVGRSILRLVPPTDGAVSFDGQNVLTASGSELRRLRRKMQIVFQDPVSSLNPRMTIGRMLAEPIKVHKLARGDELADRVAQLLQRVGLSPDYASRYPHEFSGGQRQRIGIARALALQPEFIVLDEPVSALDVSIQSQVLNLLSDLQQDLKLSYLFIAHNLAVVEHFCDRVAVMYLGKIVELADRQTIYDNARHPYTRALLSAAPRPEPGRASDRIIMPGEVPSPVNPPTGCAFHPRCDLSRKLAKESGAAETVQITIAGKAERVMKRCVDETPVLERASERAEHCAACWYKDR